MKHRAPAHEAKVHYCRAPTPGLPTTSDAIRARKAAEPILKVVLSKIAAVCAKSTKPIVGKIRHCAAIAPVNR